MKRLLAAGVLVALAACGNGASVSLEDIPELPPTTPAEVDAMLTASVEPVVLNVWASWCGPCRSEAPLLRSAVASHGDTVHFVGIDVRDTQDGARGFIAEFGIDGIDHYFDSVGAVPDSLGGVGVPLTFFYRPGGDLVHVHYGILDEQTLALWVDDISAG